MLEVRADSLELIDQVRPADREDIEGSMKSEVLESSVFPAIEFNGKDNSEGALGNNQFRAQIEGQLSLHGTSRTVRFEGQLLFQDSSIRLAGEFPLRLSEFEIRPVTALAGAIKLKDQLMIVFDLMGKAVDE